MRGITILVAACGLMAGCQTSQPTILSSAPESVAPPVTIAVPVEKPTTRPINIGSILLTGDVQKTGRQNLCAGETISDILHTASLTSPANKLTVVLVRRCPEGTTSEMIDIGQNLNVLDPRRNYELRDGDELVVSVAPSMPEGLARPLAADVPPAH